MSRATAIIKRLDKTLTRFAPPDRTVYYRTVTRIGGDDLIGRPGTATTVDTLLMPQPYFNRPERHEVSKFHSPMILQNNKVELRVDYIMLVSPTALSEVQLRATDAYIVFKNPTGVLVEQFVILDVGGMGLSNTDIFYEVALKSMSRS
jgi:hypothetical protein